MSRLDLLRNQFNETGIDGLLIGSSYNRQYLSGFSGSSGWLIISADKEIIAVDFRYVEQAERESADFTVKYVNNLIDSWLPPLLRECGIKKLGIESEHLPVDLYLRLIRSFQVDPCTVSIVPTNNVVESMRSIKEELELKNIIEACHIADSAMQFATSILKGEITEKRAAWEIEKFLRNNGSDNLPFDVIVASGPNSALPHAKPEDHLILPNEPIVIDLGARVNGYCSDMTRTFIIDNENYQFIKLYNIVLSAQLASISMINGSITTGQIDSMARDIIDYAGYADKFGHALGHGMGLEAHELPGIRKQCNDIIKDGMVFTIEPGIYVPGWGGIRIEDTVAFVDGKLQQLTNFSKNALIYGG